MRPTDALKQEHRVIEKVLKSVFTASTRMRNGEDVAPLFFRNAVDFIRNFADKCHHCKEEDVLFPAIERQGFPRDGGPVGMMLQEHEEGRAHVRELVSALEEYDKGDRSVAVRSAVFGHAIGYVQVLSQHIPKEDNILYAIADDVISATEQQSLSTTFEEVNERTLGRVSYAEYVRLADEMEKSMQALPSIT